jgi:hypothetical protein
MRKLLTTLLVLTLTSGVALADSYIGLFAVPHATHCYADTEAFTTTTVHVVAWLDDDWSGLMSACEFYIDNFPVAGAQGVISQTWSTPLVIGYVNYGIALAFNPALPGPLAYIGSIDFFTIDPAWIPADYTMAVRPSRQSDTLALVDTYGEVMNVSGGQFTFNCTNPLACDCLESVAVEPTLMGGPEAAAVRRAAAIATARALAANF